MGELMGDDDLVIEELMLEAVISVDVMVIIEPTDVVMSKC